MTLLWRLARGLAPVRRDERGLAAFLFVFMAGMVLSDWIGKIGADSLFVKRFGVEHIPAMYIVTPLAMLVTSAIVFALVPRMTPRDGTGRPYFTPRSRGSSASRRPSPTR